MISGNDILFMFFFFLSLAIFISPLDCISLHAVACTFSVFAKKCTFGVVGPVKHEINQCHIFHALLPAHPGAQIKFHTEQPEQLTCSRHPAHGFGGCKVDVSVTRLHVNPATTPTLMAKCSWFWTWSPAAVNSPRASRVCP